MHLRLKMIVNTLPCYVLRFNRITQQHNHLEVRRILIAFVIKILHSAKAAFRMTTYDVLHYNKAFSNPPFSFRRNLLRMQEIDSYGMKKDCAILLHTNIGWQEDVKSGSNIISIEIQSLWIADSQ